MKKGQKRLICRKCKKETICNLKEELIKDKVKEFNIKYLNKKYICSECNSEVFDEELYNYNIKAINDEIRKQTELVRIDEIEEIIDKYDIGKKPLSLVLGLGEVTIIRYLDGQHPTKEISELLKEIKDSPMLYEFYLEANKDKITEIAYKKSLGKTKQIELNSSNSKLYSVALYLIKNIKDSTPLALQKILYFINGFSLKFLKKSMFEEAPEAWIYGPVYKEIYNCFSYYKGNNIDYAKLFNDREVDLSIDECEYLDKMISFFGCYSGNVLIEMSHMTEPWIEARKGLKDNEPSNNKISMESILKYFDKVCKEYNIECVDDICKYSVDLFEKVKNRKSDCIS